MRFFRKGQTFPGWMRHDNVEFLNDELINESSGLEKLTAGIE